MTSKGETGGAQRCGWILPGLGAALLIAACAGGPGPEPDPLGPEPPDSAEPEAVWAYLEGIQYRTYWVAESVSRPGIHRGRPPHGPLIRSYINEKADAGRPLGKRPLPPGSVVVLEEFTTEPNLHAINVMVKIEGHRQATSDWAFLQFSPTGDVRVTDREAQRLAREESRGCIHCHSRTKKTDLLFQPRLPPRQ